MAIWLRLKFCSIRFGAAADVVAMEIVESERGYD